MIFAAFAAKKQRKIFAREGLNVVPLHPLFDGRVARESRQVREQVRDGGSFPPSAEKDITTGFLLRQNKRTLCAIDIVDIVQRKGNFLSKVNSSSSRI